MLELPKALNADWRPLTWHFHEAQDGKPTVYINDGQNLLSLARYMIEPDGIVWPSVVCRLCDFHENIKLQGWEK